MKDANHEISLISQPIFIMCEENYPINARCSTCNWQLKSAIKRPDGSEIETIISPNYSKFAVECGSNDMIS